MRKRIITDLRNGIININAKKIAVFLGPKGDSQKKRLKKLKNTGFTSYTGTKDFKD